MKKQVQMETILEEKNPEIKLEFQVKQVFKALVYGRNDENIKSAWEIDGINDIIVFDDDEGSEFIEIKIRANSEEAAEQAKRQLTCFKKEDVMNIIAEEKNSDVKLEFRVEQTLKALVYGVNNENIESARKIDGINEIIIIDNDEAEFIKIEIRASSEEAAEKARNQLFYFTDSYKVPKNVLQKFIELIPEILDKSAVVSISLGDKGSTLEEFEFFICGTEEAVAFAKDLMKLHVENLENQLLIDENTNPVHAEVVKPAEKPKRKFKTFGEIRDNKQEYFDQIKPGPTDYARKSDCFAVHFKDKLANTSVLKPASNAEQSVRTFTASRTEPALPAEKPKRKFRTFGEIRDNRREYFDQIKPGPTDYARKSDCFAMHFKDKVAGTFVLKLTSTAEQRVRTFTASKSKPEHATASETKEKEK